MNEISPEGLRLSLHQAAVEGKLVPQNSKTNNETYHTSTTIYKNNGHYYEKIKNSNKNIDDEIPFDIPDNWDWFRLIDLVTYGKNASIPSAEIPNDAIIIELENIEKNTGKINGYSKKSINDNSSRHIFKKGCLLYSKLRPYLNKVVIPGFDGYCSTEIMVIYPKLNINLEYLQLCLMAPYFIDYAMSKAYGTKMPRLGTTDAQCSLIPIPPLEEQDRICSKHKIINELIEKIINNYNEIKKIDEDMVKNLKDSILLHAVQGRLLPQNYTEQPIINMIDCPIIKQNNSYYELINGQKTCIDDEIPFSIPNNWQWSRLKDISTIKMGQSPEGKSITTNNTGIEFHQGKKCFSTKYLEQSNEKTTSAKTFAEPNSIVMSVRAPVGNVNITQRKICIGRGLCSILPKINLDYTFYYLQTQIEALKSKSTGSTFKAINGDVVKSILIPIPPMEEQERIVRRVEELLALADQLPD